MRVPYYTWTDLVLSPDGPTGNNTRIVLLAIASFAGPERALCWPGKARIAERAGVSRSTVTRVIGEAQEQGWLEVTTRARPDGGQSSNSYSLAIPGSVLEKVLGSAAAEARSEPATTRPGARPEDGRHELLQKEPPTLFPGDVESEPLQPDPAELTFTEAWTRWRQASGRFDRSKALTLKAWRRAHAAEPRLLERVVAFLQLRKAPYIPGFHRWIVQELWSDDHLEAERKSKGANGSRGFDYAAPGGWRDEG